MKVTLYTLSGDPDTERAVVMLSKADINYKVVDMEEQGILGSIDRDLDVKELPFMIVQNGKIEGLKAIEGFLRQS